MQTGELTGTWTVQSNGLTATIVQVANQLILTNEQGSQTVGQWISPTSFTAWGDTGQVTVSGTTITIDWSGNSWVRSLA